MTECPKCGGGAFLSEEDLLQILEKSGPLKAIIKAVYQCRACGERFSRIASRTLEAGEQQEQIKDEEEKVRFV